MRAAGGCGASSAPWRRRASGIGRGMAKPRMDSRCRVVFTICVQSCAAEPGPPASAWSGSPARVIPDRFTHSRSPSAMSVFPRSIHASLRPARANAKSLTLVLVAGLLAVAALPGRAESPCVGSFCWVQRGAYPGQEFTTLQTPPGNPCVVAFTGLTNNGLGVSTDCGLSFAHLLFANAYDVTARDTNVGYVAGGTAGVAKTKDTGSNWFPINSGLPAFPDVRSIVIHYAHPESAFCALHGGGVFIGGPTGIVPDSVLQWTAINEGLTDKNVRHFVRVRGGSFMLAGADGGI